MAGPGKSTVVECLAEAYGLNPQGGSAQAELFRVRKSEPDTGSQLTVVRGSRPRWSYFLRADTMNQLYTYLEENPNPRTGPERLHELSHGEAFLEILRTRVNETGFYLMDEPDAPLSFTASLGLAALLHDLAAAGGQAVVATPLPRGRGGARGEPARTRPVGNATRELGRPESGGRLARVPARSADVFPAPVLT